MQIRDEAPGDGPAIRALLEAAFRGTGEAELVERLGADGDVVISLVAVERGRLVGQVLFSQLAAPFRALALAPVSVLPERQRSGIGSRLIRAGLARAAGDGWQGVFVLGDPGYYRRFGFDPQLASGFASPYAGHGLMALALDCELPATTGRIEHAPAFAVLG